MDVLVIGAGASGLMAAITAAKNGAKVTLLEKGAKAGRKLAITGNGRCNLTNTKIDEESFRGEHPDFAFGAFGQFDVQDTVRFFSSIGIYTKNRDHGLYPYSDQAPQVVQLLMEEAQRRKVKCKCSTEITKLEKKDGRFLAHTDGWTYEADACILACGSKAAPETGADGSGYDLAAGFGHTMVPVLPALTGLKAEKSRYPKLAGLRCDGRVTVRCGDVCTSSRGELQFTSYGISGIPTFQVSHQAVRCWAEGQPVELSVNFLPDFTEAQQRAFLDARLQQAPDRSAGSFLAGLFHQKLIEVLLLEAGIKTGTAMAAVPAEKKEKLYGLIQAMPAKMTGYMDFSHAQVCSGGVSTEEIDRETMESRRVPGLYFAGEMVDIDGACGGYNLQWAWSSGHCAGLHAVTK